jgi:hypothetical protein
MLVGLFTSVYGSDEEDPSRVLAHRQYRDQLDAATQGITEALLGLDGKDSARQRAADED